MIGGQARAILWAQFRAARNMFPRGSKLGSVFSIVINILWYGLWMLGAVAIFLVIRETHDPPSLFRFLAPGLLLAFLYWQIIPVLMASTGASLHMRRIRIYPIPHEQLFLLEVMLRLTTAVEMIVLIAGATAGIASNPRLSPAYALAFVPYLLFNLYVSAGVRDLLTRLLGWRRFREVFFIFIVLLAAIPQVVLRMGIPSKYVAMFERFQQFPWPWTAASHLLVGEWTTANIAASVLWLALGYLFGRWQFERTLRFDAEAARARGNEAITRDSLLDRLFQFPARLLPDPLAALIEKELRSLVRSPRFRMVFLMGFTFGLLVWLPMAFRQGRSSSSFIQSHFLVIVSAYAMMLLSEVGIWNVLGFDRSAAQLYWLAPIKTHLAIISKNITIALFVVLELLLITTICMLFRLPVSPQMFFDSLAVCLILLLMLAAAGNLISLRAPRPLNPNDPWRRSSASRFQALLILLYPVMGTPFAFAFYARSKWESDAVFYLCLLAIATAAAIAYGFSLERVIDTISRRREQILSELGAGGSPIST